MKSQSNVGVLVPNQGRPPTNVGKDPFMPFATRSGRYELLKNGIDLEVVWWLATNRRVGATWEDRWKVFKDARPECFDPYVVLDLALPSLNLPAGKVAFVEDDLPEQESAIIDNPPLGILVRLKEARSEFPDANFVILQPAFQNDHGSPTRLVTAAELKEEAFDDYSVCTFNARLWGWAIRPIDLGFRMMVKLRIWTRYTLSLPRRAVLIARQKVAKRRLRIEQQKREAATEEEWRNLERDVAQAEQSLRLMQQHLNDADREQVEFALSISGEDPANRRDRLRALGNHLMPFDPIIAFTLPDEPDVLRLVGHWYWTKDGGKAKLHFHA